MKNRNHTWQLLMRYICLSVTVVLKEEAGASPGINISSLKGEFLFLRGRRWREIFWWFSFFLMMKILSVWWLYLGTAWVEKGAPWSGTLRTIGYISVSVCVFDIRMIAMRLSFTLVLIWDQSWRGPIPSVFTISLHIASQGLVHNWLNLIYDFSISWNNNFNY